MKKTIALLFGLAVLISCNSKKDDKSSSMDSLSVSQLETSLYAQVDSTFKINGKEFRINVKQFDLTETAIAKGDTMSRPTYQCIVNIFDSNKKIVLTDSLTRESWGYPGKIVSIDAYQIAMPMLTASGNEIILQFKVFEMKDDDTIDGFIAFDVNKLTARYYWQESTLEE